MNQFTKFFAVKSVSLSALLSLSFVFLSACSGGGAEIEDNPTQQTTPTSGYSGPAPSTDDVQSFKVSVWDNLSASNRCGQCHGVGQLPDFANLDDINTAYSEANTIVDLSSPKDSLMATKVASGHNCWLSSDSACGDTITSYITAWAGDAAASSATIVLEEPPIREPGDSKTFPPNSDLFSQTIHPILTAQCSDCHAESSASPISPFFADANVELAYEAAKSKIDLDTPENSRFVVRLRNEFHNCWSDCSTNADEMLAAIENFANQIVPTEVDPSLLKSHALFLTDGIVASGGGRYEPNAIAVWNFKTGSGGEAFDTSGVDPAINLKLSGSYNWVGGWGVQIVDGKAQGSTGSSKKIHDQITATGEYSVEAWLVPSNVTQEGPAGIISYSAGTTDRNFTLGQTLYNYNFSNRSSETDQNGQPFISTPDADEILQTSLQHVVATFNPTEGKKVFVNGLLVSSEDVETGGSLNDWNDTYALVFGNEADSSRLWAGTFRMVVIHNRSLTQEQIVQNFDVGVGEKFFLLFGISHLVDDADSYVMYEVSQFDSYAYLFSEPTYVNLNSAIIPDNLDIEKIRIAINGKEAITGQAFKNLVSNVGSTTYSSETGQLLSRLGTVINLEKGPSSDEFFLTFEKINGQQNPFVELPPPPPSDPVDLAERPEIGLRNFAEINATMSKVTGIPMNNVDVQNTYNTVKQQMPTLTDIDIFVSSQQMGITQLAIEYCNALVEDSSAKASYFPGFDFSVTANLAFDNTSKRDQVLAPLLTNALGTNLSSQPTDIDVKTELNSLMDKLTTCAAGCDVEKTNTVVKAVCAATIANAAMLVQ
jgi:hypothetical protein